jgi:hypothetical protein
MQAAVAKTATCSATTAAKCQHSARARDVQSVAAEFQMTDDKVNRLRHHVEGTSGSQLDRKNGRFEEILEAILNSITAEEAKTRRHMDEVADRLGWSHVVERSEKRP